MLHLLLQPHAAAVEGGVDLGEAHLLQPQVMLQQLERTHAERLVDPSLLTRAEE